MTDTSTRNAAMTQGRRADSARRRQRVLKALNDTTNQGEPISVSGIARRAGVDRSFLYRHRDLLEQIHAAEAQPPNAPGVGPAVSRASLQADLTNAHQRAVRLAGSPTRTASLRSARRTGMARVRSRRPRRHRPAQATDQHARTTRHRSAAPTRRTRRRSRRRPSRQPRTHGAAQPPEDRDMSPIGRHVHHTCCSSQAVITNPLTCPDAAISVCRRRQTPGEPPPRPLR